MDDIAISVRNLSKCYRRSQKNAGGRPGLWDWLRPPQPLRDDDPSLFWALRDVSFELPRGERLGIIGRNGAGKSTLLKILAHLVYPSKGEARVRGRVTPLLDVGTGMNDVLTGRENVFLMGSLRGLTPDQVRERLDEIIEFSGLGDFIHEPVKTYSSGMRSRLGFAVAAHLNPDILLLDEVLAVGDMNFVQKCLRKVEGLTAHGRTVVFVSHSLGDVARFCHKALWLEQGRVVMHGPVQEVAEAYSSSMLGLVAEARPEVQKAAPEAAGAAQERGPADPERPAAEILAFRLLDAQDRPKTAFVRKEPLRVHLRYRALRSDLPLIAAVHVHREGIHVLSSHPRSVHRPGGGEIHDAVLEIPPLLLNKGVYHFSAAVVTPVRPILRHACLESAISCAVFDELSEDDIFSGDYRGVVRPELQWKVNRHGS